MAEESAKTLSPEEVAEIAERTAKATPEPWTAERGYAGAERTLFLNRGPRFDGVLFGRSCDAVEKTQHEADTVFAAHARQDIPRLIATVAAKDAEIARLRQAVRLEIPVTDLLWEDLDAFDITPSDEIVAVPRWLLDYEYGAKGFNAGIAWDIRKAYRAQLRTVPQGEEEKP